MTFVYPQFLWALSAVTIPIIIHIFNFRRYKTIYYSNTNFLQNIQSQAKTKQNLKQLLILLMRILAIVSLVIAFAKPISKKDVITKADCNSFSIYVDNSFSMDALSQAGTNMEVAKDRTTSIVSAFPQNAVYLLITNSLSPSEQHFYPKKIILNNIANIQTSPFVRKTSFVVEKINQLYFSEKNNIRCPKKIFLVSDFQKNTFDFDKIPLDTNYFYYLIPITPIEAKNLSIDTIWFSSPYHLYNAFDTLFIKIKNYSSDLLINRKITLYINGSAKIYQNFDIEPNSTQIVKIVYQNEQKGLISGKVEIDDFPITYDNSMYFSYTINTKAKVLIVQENSNPLIEKFYSDTNNFELNINNDRNINLSELQNFDAILLFVNKEFSTGFVDQIAQFISTGGNLIIIPQNKTNKDYINKLFEKFNLPKFASLDTNNYTVRKIDLSDKIYKNSFIRIDQQSRMPFVYEHFVISSTSQNINKLLVLENDDIFLYSKNIDNGFVYVFTSDLNRQNTEFLLNPIATPTLFNIAYLSRSEIPIYLIVGKNQVLRLKKSLNSEVIKIKNTTTNIELFPYIRHRDISSITIDLNSEILTAGNYIIFNESGTISGFSLNYDRQESDPQFYTSSELQKIIDDKKLQNVQIITSAGISLQQDVASNYKMSNLWKIFIIFALLFLLAEILIIRNLKI